LRVTEGTVDDRLVNSHGTSVVVDVVASFTVDEFC